MYTHPTIAHLCCYLENVMIYINLKSAADGTKCAADGTASV